MTKKDYELIALVVRENLTDSNGAITGTFNGPVFVEALTRALKIDNPKFDAGKFLSACDPTLSGR